MQPGYSRALCHRHSEAIARGIVKAFSAQAHSLHASQVEQAKASSQADAETKSYLSEFLKIVQFYLLT